MTQVQESPETATVHMARRSSVIRSSIRQRNQVAHVNFLQLLSSHVTGEQVLLLQCHCWAKLAIRTKFCYLTSYLRYKLENSKLSVRLSALDGLLYTLHCLLYLPVCDFTNAWIHVLDNHLASLQPAALCGRVEVASELLIHSRRG